MAREESYKKDIIIIGILFFIGIIMMCILSSTLLVNVEEYKSSYRHLESRSTRYDNYYISDPSQKDSSSLGIGTGVGIPISGQHEGELGLIMDFNGEIGVGIGI